MGVDFGMSEEEEAHFFDDYFDIIDDIEEGETDDLIQMQYDLDEAYGDLMADQDQAITDTEGS